MNITSSKEFTKTGLRYLRSEFLRCAYIVRLSTHRYPWIWTGMRCVQVETHRATRTLNVSSLTKPGSRILYISSLVNRWTLAREEDQLNFSWTTLNMCVLFLSPVVKTGLKNTTQLEEQYKGNFSFKNIVSVRWSNSARYVGDMINSSAGHAGSFKHGGRYQEDRQILWGMFIAWPTFIFTVLKEDAA